MVAARVDRRRPKVEGEGGGGQEGGNWREKGNGSEGGRRRICSSCVAHVVERETRDDDISESVWVCLGANLRAFTVPLSLTSSVSYQPTTGGFTLAVEIRRMTMNRSMASWTAGSEGISMSA
jgi:hypothetical protein